jgi:hypothetical protein
MRSIRAFDLVLGPMLTLIGEFGGAGLRAGESRTAGAGTRNRTADLLITNQSLYRLSYSGRWGSAE